jgi:hypothetical protein
LLPCYPETKATLPVDIVRVEFNLNGLHDNALNISGFCDEDGRSVELMWCPWLILGSAIADLSRCSSQMCRYPDVHGMACLPNVDPTTPTGDPVNTRCP